MSDCCRPQASNPGIEGRIAYVNGGELHVVNTDGTQDHNILGTQCSEVHEPHWAPDSSVISFISLCGQTGTWDLATIKPNGNNFQIIVATAADEAGASFSPDGSRIAYCSGEDGDSDIYTADPDGSNRTKLTMNKALDCSPTWSPDGSRIAFVSNRTRAVYDYRLYTMAADGSDVVQVSDYRAAYPSWSSDGSRIAYQGEFGLEVIHPDGSGHRTFPDPNSNLNFPDWSPDSTHIVGAAADQVWVMDSDGGNPEAIASGGQPSWETLPGNGAPNLWFDVPQSVPLDSTVKLTGQVVIPGGTASGQQLHAYSYPPGGGEVDLGTAPTDGSGAFEFTTSPGSLGQWSYKVVMSANANHGSATYTTTLEATEHSSAITLNPPTHRVIIHTPAHLTGNLTVDGAASPGNTVTLYGGGPGSGLNMLGTAQTASDGSFSFVTTPDVAGSWQYEVRWEGDANTPPATASVTVGVYMIETGLTMHISRNKATYGEKVQFDFRLSHAPANSRITVSVFNEKFRHKVFTCIAKHGRASKTIRARAGYLYLPTTPVTPSTFLRERRGNRYSCSGKSHCVPPITRTGLGRT